MFRHTSGTPTSSAIIPCGRLTNAERVRCPGTSQSRQLDFIVGASRASALAVVVVVFVGAFAVVMFSGLSGFKKRLQNSSGDKLLFTCAPALISWVQS